MDARSRGDRPDDAALVVAAVAGDRAAFAAIYDRYADRLYDFCHSLLRDREEAADATQDAFVMAAERLGQLRHPERLRPWLYAVARTQALARIRARKRTATESEVSDLPDPSSGPADLAEQTELQVLVWNAAAGLSERDRALLDLHLRHGLEGAELGETMGVGANHAYVLLSRLRDQVERSLGALLVARLGRDDCPELSLLLTGWDGRFSPLIRKRVARHVDDCDLCSERRRAVASPLSLLAAVPLMPAPAGLRDRVLDRVELTGGRGGPGNGAGPGNGGGIGGGGIGRRLLSGRSRGWMVAAALLGAAALLAAVIGGILLAGRSGPGASGGAPGVTAVAAIGGPPGASGPAATPSSAAAVAPTSTAPGTSGPATSAAGGGGGGGATTTAPAAPGAPTATTSAPAPGALAVTPAQVDLGATQDTASVLLRNSGGVALTWSATASAAWLRASPAQGSLDPGGQTRLTVTADRAGLAEGTASGAVQLAWQGGSTRVRVQLAVERPPRIGQLTATPMEILVPSPGCAGTTALAQAVVDDESGLASVVLEWGDGPTRVPMTERSGTWFAQLGPVAKPATIPWRVVATDTRGNTATADGPAVVAVLCRS
jgi:RNA polymerase sigma factor (sigma-70 family)